MARCKMPLLLMAEQPVLLPPQWFGTSWVTFTPTSRNVAGISLSSSLTATGANSAAHDCATGRGGAAILHSCVNTHTPAGVTPVHGEPW
jgi:hypothetical protein